MEWPSQTWLDQIRPDDRDFILRNLKQLRDERGEAFWNVLRIISESDPVNLLCIGAPPDEYEPEARTIYPRLRGAQSVKDVRQIVEEEFGHWFGKIPSGAVVDTLAANLWHMWNARDSESDPARG
jgi:hypothetical protein